MITDSIKTDNFVSSLLRLYTLIRFVIVLILFLGTFYPNSSEHYTYLANVIKYILLSNISKYPSMSFKNIIYNY